MKKFRSGAASFYIVAIATLLFSVIAISFAALVVSEIRRTSDSDLSQSAYDSALAGIEDAKTAYLSYLSCVNQGATSAMSNPSGSSAPTCADIIWYMEHPDCDMVAHILGRISKDEAKEVIVEETNTGKNGFMQQAYTCVKITQNLSDYRSTINSTNSSRLIKVNLSNNDTTNISSIRLSWYSDNDGLDYNFTDFKNNKVVFPLRSSNLSTPPTISIQLIQTATTFTLDQFTKTVGNRTNRGTLFLVPTDDTSPDTRNSTYISAYSYSGDNTANKLTEDAFLKSNDKTVENLPYLVYCPKSSSNEFACSITIDIPHPLGDGSRSSDTFAFVVSLPYGGPDTDFALAYCTADGACTDASIDNAGTAATNNIKVVGGQIEIDSTGRANDLFRRVEARIDTYDSNYSYPEYAIELLGTGTVLTKEIIATTEWGEYGKIPETVKNHTITIARNNASYGTVSTTSFSKVNGTSLPASGATTTSITIGGTTVTATPATGYMFKNWTHSCGGTLTGACTITANFEVASTTFAKAYASAGKSQTNGYYKMQDMTSSICSAVTAGQSASLIDTRSGNEVYLVAKLADGKCWMLDNLRLGGDSAITLKNTDTNISDTSWTLPASKSWGKQYTNPYINSHSKNKTTTSYGAGSGKIGVYYNFCAASAGTVCPDYNSKDASSDVCPKGWRLPTGGNSGEFKNLYVAYKSDYSSFRAALSTPLSGIFESTGVRYDGVFGKANYLGVYGRFWSSSRYDKTSMYYLYVKTSSVDPAGANLRYYGLPIRCVSK